MRLPPWLINGGPLTGCLVIGGFFVLSTAGIFVVAGLDALGERLFPQLFAPAEPPGTPIDPAGITVGLGVWVEWNGRWFESTVREVSPDHLEILVHYEGYADSADERVPPTRVRRR